MGDEECMYIDLSFERFIFSYAGDQKNGVIAGERCDFINGRYQTCTFSESTDF